MSEYLAHYGVMGMKWGVHSPETERRYAAKKYNKAVKKAEKLQRNVSKTRLRRAKRERQYIRKDASIWRDESSVNAARRKMNRAKVKEFRAIKRATKWANKMNSKFKNTDLSEVSPEVKAAGKQFVRDYTTRKIKGDRDE